MGRLSFLSSQSVLHCIQSDKVLVMSQDPLNAPIIDSADGMTLDPAQFAVFDNEGLTKDRYTVFPYLSLRELSDAGRGVALVLSPEPERSDGISQWLDISARAAVRSHSIDLGRSIPWSQLPAAVRAHVRYCLSEEGGSYDTVAEEIASLSRV